MAVPGIVLTVIPVQSKSKKQAIKNDVGYEFKNQTSIVQIQFHRYRFVFLPY